MVTLPIYDMQGAKVGDYELDLEQIAPRINKQLLHDAVVMYLSNLRQGSSKTKSRGEVSGSTKKLYRQKGTGNARMGSRRMPQRRGGGHAKTIEPRSWYYRMPKKAIRLATRMAIASKIQSGQVVVVDRLAFDAPKTRVMAEALRKLGIDGMSATVATPELDRMVYRSGRNIPGVTVMPAQDLNALAVLRPKRLVLTREVLDRLTQPAGAVAAG